MASTSASARMSYGGRSSFQHAPRQPTSFRHSTQVNKKVAQLRWLRTGPAALLPDSRATEYFVQGSWGEKENEVSLWKLSMEDSKPDVRLMKSLAIVPSVTGIAPLKHNLFGLTSSAGDLSLYRLTQLDSHGTNPESFDFLASNKLHAFKKSSFPCPATGIASNDTSVVSVGEDGSIYEVALENNQVVRSLEFADPLSLCTVDYVGRTHVATGNMGGQVHIWDLSGESGKPVQTLNHLDELSGAVSIAQHPTQSHVLLVGLNSGSLSLFDLRGGGSSGPVAKMQQQEGAVSEIYFHGITPDHFFTCSQSGDMLHWFPGSDNGQSLVQNNDCETDLNLEFLKFGLAYKTLHASPFPINSFSLSPNNRLICGGDSGILFSTELIHF